MKFEILFRDKIKNYISIVQFYSMRLQNFNKNSFIMLSMQNQQKFLQRECTITTRNFPRKKVMSKLLKPSNYMLEPEVKQIGYVVTQRNRVNNASYVTLKFEEYQKCDSQSKLNMGNSLIRFQDGKNKIIVPRQNFENQRKISLNEFNFKSLNSKQYDVKRLNSEIFSRRVMKFKQKQQNQNNQSNFLQVTGGTIQKRKKNQIRALTTERKTSVSGFRVKRKTIQSSQNSRMKKEEELLTYLRRPSIKKDYFIFGLSGKTQTPQNRIQIYRDFLWKINYSNNCFVKTPQILPENGYKIYIGTGNNSIMIRSIIRRRPWWSITDQVNEANFIWTQLKFNQFFKLQERSTIEVKQIYSKSTEEISNKQEHELENQLSKIFNIFDYANWKQHWKKNKRTQQKINQLTYIKRINLLTKKKLIKIEKPQNMRLQNHLNQNYFIGNKKALFYSLKFFYEFFGKQNLFSIIPQTFHISKGINDPQYSQFLSKFIQYQQKRKKNKQLKNIWIVKPGQNTNRGNGISICFSLDDVKCRIRGKEKNKDGSLRTFIVQKYMQKPLLFKTRKFDIRHFILITCFGGVFKAFWFEEGYVRTSSSPFNLKQTKNLYIHLTNDAIQKNSSDYGKYEKGNKLSYDDLESYIFKLSKKLKIGNAVSFKNNILPEMKNIALEAVKSTYLMLDSEKKMNNFELLGLDFMIDQNFNPFLIQVNTNPCLELSCPLLSKIIPEVIQNTFRLTVDPFFLPPEILQNNKKSFFQSQNPLEQNRFQLIFDEAIDGQKYLQMYQNREQMINLMGKIEQEDEVFENEGDEAWEQGQVKKQ